MSALDEAKTLLTRSGFAVLREKSYRATQERQRVAEVHRAAEADNAKHARTWAVNCLDEERRLRDRLTFVFGVARAHGATDDDLRSPAPDGHRVPNDVLKEALSLIERVAYLSDGRDVEHAEHVAAAVRAALNT